MAQSEVPVRRPLVYHIMLAGRRHVAAASTLVMNGPRIALQLDPEVVKRHDVFLEIDPRKLRPLDEEGWIYGYPELADRRSSRPRRQQHLAAKPARNPGRRASDGSGRR